MKWNDWVGNWGMTSLKFKASFLEMEWKPQDEDKEAAWEMYVELLTRTATQSLDRIYGDEKSALNSVYWLFDITRRVLKTNTRKYTEFTKVAIVILNQVVRPFTSKWHRFCEDGLLDTEEGKELFRSDLLLLQYNLKIYSKMLADMAGVEDLTELRGYPFNSA